MQLRAKQRARRYYGVNEVQFHHYFEMAERKVGVTGENLLRILESRLDNVVYRAGFASSRAEARQLVGHGHFTVNGKKVNIPSYLVKEGDVVAMTDKSKDSDKINLLRAFIYAPDDVRIHNIMESHNLTEKDARILLLEKDKRYHKRHLALTGSNRGDRHNRNILIDSSYLGIEGTADYIEELVRRKFGSGEE